jgi:hypothetical protein
LSLDPSQLSNTDDKKFETPPSECLILIYVKTIKIYLNQPDFHRKNGINDFDQKVFSMNDVLDFVSKDGDAWSNLVSSEITRDLVEKFLIKKSG